MKNIFVAICLNFNTSKYYLEHSQLENLAYFSPSCIFMHVHEYSQVKINQNDINFHKSSYLFIYILKSSHLCIYIQRTFKNLQVIFIFILILIRNICMVARKRNWLALIFFQVHEIEVFQMQ